MTNISYDADADAVYITVGRGKVDRTKRPARSSTMSTPRGTLSASRSSPPARFWHRETGKKPARRATRASTRRHSRSSRRRRLRKQGLRLVQYWVPDLRDPKVLAEIRREAAVMSHHPEDEIINDWIEASYDWDSWK